MTDDSSPRLQPIDPTDWPEVLAEYRSTFFGEANVYKVMAHHPALLKAWANLRQHVVINTSLGREKSEIVILRAAAKTGSNYEWTHHVERARRLGMDDTRIASIKGNADDMMPEDAVIASAVDELIGGARLSLEVLQGLTDNVGKQGVLDLMATVGFYSTLAFLLNSFETEIEPEIVAASKANPLQG